MSHIFVSYSSKDRALVEELAADIDLLLDNVTIWFDRELNRSGGHQWWQLICEEIRRCDVFVNVLTPHVLKSEPCRREYSYACALGKPVLPVMLEDVEIRHLPVELQAAQIVDFRLRSREQQRSLKFSLRNVPLAPSLPANALELAPDAPLDPAGVLFDRIARLSADPDQQRLLILDIEDLHENEGFQIFIPDLLMRLLERDDVLTVRNLRRAEDLRSRIGKVSKFSPSLESETQNIVPRTVKSATYRFVPAPFAWIDIPSRGYGIAKYPITNAQFAKFMEADGYNQRKWWTDAGWDAKLKGLDWDNKNSGWVETRIAWTAPRYWTDSRWNEPDQPVVGVSWYEAEAFCLWLSDVSGEKIMLPTEDQWQYAAQGDDKRDYPWGNKWDASCCNNNVDKKGIGKTTPVRQYEGKGDSPFGLVDMAGNVWEWCLNDFKNKVDNSNNHANNRVLRGGAWISFNEALFRCGYRSAVNPSFSDNNYGFRVSRFIYLGG